MVEVQEKKMKSLPYFKWANPIHLLALGFGTGTAPKAPGTFGTLVGVLFYWPMSFLMMVILMPH